MAERAARRFYERQKVNLQELVYGKGVLCAVPLPSERPVSAHNA